MNVELPSWFKYRQGNAEPAADNLLKLTGPNLREAFIGIRPEDGGWRAFVRTQPDSEEVARSSSTFETTSEAWNVAFELFRNHFIA